MRKLRAEIGRLFGFRYVVTVDFQQEVRLHRRRRDLFGDGDYAHVYDVGKIGHFRLETDGTCSGSASYIKRWVDYEDIRQLRS